MTLSQVRGRRTALTCATCRCAGGHTACARCAKCQIRTWCRSSIAQQLPNWACVRGSRPVESTRRARGASSCEERRATEKAGARGQCARFGPDSHARDVSEMQVGHMGKRVYKETRRVLYVCIRKPAGSATCGHVRDVRGLTSLSDISHPFSHERSRVTLHTSTVAVVTHTHTVTDTRRPLRRASAK